MHVKHISDTQILSTNIQSRGENRGSAVFSPNMQAESSLHSLIHSRGESSGPLEQLQALSSKRADDLSAVSVMRRDTSVSAPLQARRGVAPLLLLLLSSGRRPGRTSAAPGSRAAGPDRRKYSLTAHRAGMPARPHLAHEGSQEATPRAGGGGGVLAVREGCEECRGGEKEERNIRPQISAC